MTTAASISLPPDMPSRMRQLRRDKVGRPIPWFVGDVNGEPDFRFMDGAKLVQAIKEQLCFICGQKLNRNREANGPKGVFVAGPMCLINRTSAEPPNHGDCAEWSSKACPFLTKPLKIRRTSDIPDTVVDPAGFSIERNPGVTALIESERWSYFQVPDGLGGKGILFEFQRITNVRWMSEGKAADPDQVLVSIDTGLPQLVEMAQMELGAMPVLARKTRDAMRWLPSTSLAPYPVIQSVLAELP
jgi:hypothetical protein